MTDPQTSERKGIRKNGSFRIEAFLNDNYRLFAIMGVFGALAIYLKNLSANGNQFPINIGIVACFILFMLVSLLILWKAIEEHSDVSLPNGSLAMIIERFNRFLFVIPFFTLVMAIAYYIVTAFPAPFAILLGVILSMVGIIASVWILDSIYRIVKKPVLSDFIGSISLAILSGIGFHVVPNTPTFSPIMFFLLSFASASALFFIIGSIGLIRSLIGRLLHSG